MNTQRSRSVLVSVILLNKQLKEQLYYRQRLISSNENHYRAAAHLSSCWLVKFFFTATTRQLARNKGNNMWIFLGFISNKHAHNILCCGGCLGRADFGFCAADATDEKLVKQPTDSVLWWVKAMPHYWMFIICLSMFPSWYCVTESFSSHGEVGWYFGGHSTATSSSAPRTWAIIWF